MKILDNYKKPFFLALTAVVIYSFTNYVTPELQRNDILLASHHERAIEDINFEDLPFSKDDILVSHPKTAFLSSKNSLYRTYDQEKALIGYIAIGPPEGENITGFAGRVPLLIALNRERKVLNIQLLPNQETPGYERKVREELSDKWTTKRIEDAVDLDVDTVSGATMTSSAVIDGVRSTLESIAERPELGIEEIDERETDFLMTLNYNLPEIITIVFLLATLILYFSKKKNKSIRYLQKILCILIPGLLTAAVLSLPTFSSWLGGRIAITRHGLLLFIAVSALAIPLLTGKNFYCYNFCPYGAAQDLIKRFNKGKSIKINRFLRKLFAFIRWGVIVLAAINTAFIWGIDLSIFEPFSAFRWRHAPWSSRILAVVFLIAAFFIPRLWCRICPTGGIIEAFRVKKDRGGING